MSTERIAELRASIESDRAELRAIGFPANVPLDTEFQILRSNAQQTIIANRLQKLNISIGTAENELRQLLNAPAGEFPDDAALLNIVCQLSGSSTETAKTTHGRTSMRAFRKLLAEARAGAL